MNAHPDGSPVTDTELRELCVKIGVNVDAIAALHNEALIRSQYLTRTAQVRFELMCAGFLTLRTTVREIPTPRPASINSFFLERKAA